MGEGDDDEEAAEADGNEKKNQRVKARVVEKERVREKAEENGRQRKQLPPRNPAKQRNPKRMDLVRRVQVRSQLRNPRERPRKKVWERM